MKGLKMSGAGENDVVVIGLGYVGLTLAVYLADIGMKVHGVEIRDLVLEKLQEKRAFFLEENLDDTLARVIENHNFTFSKEIPHSGTADLARTFIITVGTPLLNDGTPNLDFIERVGKQVANAINHGDLIILRSTVRIGVTNQLIRPILDQSKKSFSLTFCPERTLEGAALKELGTLPQIIGADSNFDAMRGRNFFQKITSSVVSVSSIETAEAIKLVDNMQRDAHFAISNEVARICNQLSISASEVISAGKLGYPRTNLASPGPVGGPCLEKDSYLLNETFDSEFSLSLTARKVNEAIVQDSVEHFDAFLRSSQPLQLESLKVGLIGLAFKGVPETNDLRGSIALKVITELRGKFPSAKLLGFDPVLLKEEIDEIGIVGTEDIGEIFHNSDIVLLLNNHPMIATLNLSNLSKLMVSGGMIYDYWGRFDNVPHNINTVTYSSWGSHGVKANHE
jgi:UDP-N-acetyl-D-mannosaminuronic acid dehydrogenase